MTNSNKSLFILLGFTALFHVLFWHEQLALNLVIFHILLLGYLFIDSKTIPNKEPLLSSLVAFIITGWGVIFYNSGFSIVMHMLSFWVLVGFVHESTLRANYLALWQLASNVGWQFNSIHKFGSGLKDKNASLRVSLRWLRIAVIPMLIVFVFYLLYDFANPFFSDLASQFLSQFWQGFVNLFEDISFVWLLFIMAGMLFTATIIYRHRMSHIQGLAASLQDDLARRKTGALPPYMKLLSLKNEMRIGLLMLVMLNILLLCVNLVDINKLWFGFTVPHGFSMKQFVHEGTYVLLFSILLSAAVVLYFFRRNLHFYKNNKWIKNAAYLWIAQNMILCVSVFLRNYYYINYHGLAYRRVGVVIFLVLTFIGLITLLVKVNQIKSAYFLWRTNSRHVLLALCLAAGLFDWEAIILQFNLNHWNKSQIDIDFYFDSSTRMLPLLEQNKAKIAAQMEAHATNEYIWVEHLQKSEIDPFLEKQLDRFGNRKKEESWASWNYADWKVNRFIRGTFWPKAITRTESSVTKTESRF